MFPVRNVKIMTPSLEAFTKLLKGTLGLAMAFCCGEEGDAPGCFSKGQRKSVPSGAFSV